MSYAKAKHEERMQLLHEELEIELAEEDREIREADSQNCTCDETCIEAD